MVYRCIGQAMQYFVDCGTPVTDLVTRRHFYSPFIVIGSALTAVRRSYGIHCQMICTLQDPAYKVRLLQATSENGTIMHIQCISGVLVDALYKFNLTLTLTFNTSACHA